MQKLARSDLMSLEEYATKRDAFRREIMAHKKHRALHIGPNATLYFEDRLTMQYQIQEMLRVERIFEAEAIQDELDAYNPLIPDGRNWKATFMIEFADVDERRRALARLVGIEDRIWLQVEGHEKILPFVDEDLERDTPDKTSAVHFMRFELADTMADSLKQGAGLRAGIDHAAYQYAVDVPEDVRGSLVRDLD